MKSSLAEKDYHSKLVKYLGIKTDENRNWKHIHDNAKKFNRANDVLCKIRK